MNSFLGYTCSWSFLIAQIIGLSSAAELVNDIRSKKYRSFRGKSW